MAGRRRGPVSVVQRVDQGTAELVPDPDLPGCWTLLVDGVPQSYVDTLDPTRLEFDYVRRLAWVLDAAAPPGEPVRVLHLGGGALTLPRYVAATRPGSVQRVVECDAALIDLVRRELPLPRGADLRVRHGDARAVVAAAAAARFDVVVTDVYRGARMPGEVTTVEFAAQVARVLKPGGLHAVNLTDRAPLAFTRGIMAALGAAFADTALIAEPGVLRGRRFGNLVAAAVTGGGLPVAEITAAAAGEVFRPRVVHGAALVRFLAGARPVTDAAAPDSPVPPRGLFR
jgi:hypothetical protein